MRRTFGRWLLPVWLATIAAVAVYGEEPHVVQVSPDGFSVLWQAPSAATPGISVFSDEGGSIEITGNLRIEAFPLHTGDLYLPEGYIARGVRRSLEQGMAESGSMLVRVSGCEPGTTYYFQVNETPLAVPGPGRTLPDAAPLPSVRTTDKTGFVAGSRQLLVEFSRDDLAGRALLLKTPSSPYGLAAVIGDGAGPNQAFFNLDDLVSADGSTTGGLSGENTYTLTLFGSPDSRPAAETTLTFSGVFEVANAEVFVFGLDDEPVTVAGFAFDAVGPQTVGVPFTVTIRAVDSLGRTVPSFDESVDLSATGNLASGGGTTTPFEGGVLASYLVAVTDPGEHELLAQDADGREGASGIFTVSTAYSFWQLANYPDEADREDPEIGGPGADPGGRGVPNLLRYAFYLNGANPSTRGLPAAGSEVFEDGKRYLTVRYRRAKGATDLNYLAEVGSGLADWQSGPEYTEIVRVEDAGAWEDVTVRDLTPMEEASKRFMRLRVTGSPTFAGWQGEQIAKGGGLSGDLSAYAPGAPSPVDGIPNLLRYALGLEPDVYQRHLLPAYGEVEIDNERYVSLTFNRPKDRDDMDYIVEVSRNLADWFSGSDYTEVVSVIDAGDSETVTVRDRTSFNASDRRFIRLRVVQR